VGQRKGCVNSVIGPLPAAGTIPTVAVVAIEMLTTTETQDGWEEWRRHARCRGPAGADFYPPFAGERKRERHAREQRAKAVCATCTVRSECLAQAVADGERYGVWGGLTFEERLTFRRTA
jgi:WhiB family redox-sensing transcriptional regulator